jgi:zinc transport system substrate-binding protein
LSRFCILGSLLFCLFISACNKKKEENTVPVITVSILPQKFIAEQICGDKFAVKVLLPPGANHETYEPTPRDMASLEEANLYFSIGYLDFELNWLPRFTAGQQGLKVINTSVGIHLIEGHDHHDVHGRGIDPHTWLSTTNVKIQARNIASALMKSDTIHSAYFKHRLEKFEHLADSIDNQIRIRLSSCPGKPFLIFHPALAYFARQYGLEQISIEFEGKEPSAARIRELIDISRKKKIGTIYISREFDTRNAAAIAEEINAKVIVFDPMSADWAGNMIHLAELIAENQ